MTVVWHNPLLSVKKLAEYTDVGYDFLLEATRRKDNPLPTIKPGKQRKVYYSDFYNWSHELYGNDGPERGQEIFEFGRRSKR